MIDHLIFILYFFTFLFSTIGYGFIFSKYISKDLLLLNIGYQGLIGFFLLSILSIFSSFFFSHNFLFNFVVHLFGIISFVLNFKFKKKKSDIKLLFILIFLYWLGVYVYKNHDDFPYYHLTYALNLSENGFIIGTGNFSHGFRTFSTLFYYHSILYMPLIKFYLFHVGPLFIMIFTNLIILKKLKNKYENNEIDFIYFFSLFTFIFTSVVFYRIGEHGTDRSAQILLFLIFILFFELFFYEKKKQNILLNLNILLILIFMASGMKAIYYLYLILIPIILIKKNFFNKFLIKKNILIISFLSLSLSLNLLTNYFNTGCFLYPAEKTCAITKEWSIPKKEVKKMAIHYEWWAKAGGGPGYKSEMKKELYVKNFNWLENWIERHFFNKVSDTLAGILLISLIVFVTFRFSAKKKKYLFKNSYFIGYFVIIIFLIEWFLNHPTLRYGGYTLLAIPFFIYVSSVLEKYSFDKKKIYLGSIFLIMIATLIFNTRNLLRINDEINKYQYDLISSPYFFVKNIKFEKTIIGNEMTIYTPERGEMCWAIKTPCSYGKNLRSKDFLWMKVVYRNEK